MKKEWEALFAEAVLFAASVVTREERWQLELREPAGLREYVKRPSEEALKLARVVLDLEEGEVMTYREIPPLPESLGNLQSITSTDIECRSELSYVFGWLQGAQMPQDVIDRVGRAIEASDRLLVFKIERLEREKNESSS